MKKFIERRGGVRPNSGPKLKYGEKTKQITFGCPESMEVEFTEYCNNKLKTYLKNDVYIK
ncbi:MAG: hypothetical protein WAW57_15265 [Lutibacter sp.]